MEYDVFKAGVAPGAPLTQKEIKMLICYVLAQTPTAISFEILHEALREHELVNYFALVETLDRLAESGHIYVERDAGKPDCYSITEQGKDAARELTSALPSTMRDKALAGVTLAIQRSRRLSEVSVRETSEKGGFLLELSIPDLGGDLVSLQVFAPTRQQCALIKRRFLNDPVFIYQQILALLTGDSHVLGDISPENKAIF